MVKSHFYIQILRDLPWVLNTNHSDGSGSSDTFRGETDPNPRIHIVGKGSGSHLKFINLIIIGFNSIYYYILLQIIYDF